MNRLTRIALNVFGPPIVASLYYSLITAASGGINLLHIPSMFLAVLMYAAFFAALPSIAHATLMELTYTHLPPEKLTASLISAASGFIAGMVVAFLLTGGTGVSWTESAFHPIERIFPALGLATGLTLGLIIMLFSRENPARRNAAP